LDIERKKKKPSDLLNRLEVEGAVFNGEWRSRISDEFAKGRMQLLYTIVFRTSITSRIIAFAHETESYLIFTDTF